MLVEAPRPSDDLETFKRRVCLAISRLSTSKLGQSASPAFAGLTVGGGTVSSTLIGQWNTAYSWGDHAGLYDPIGTAAGEIDDHESTYDHSLLHSPVTLDVLTGITLTGQQLSYTAGYAIPTTAKQAEWDSAYTHKTTEDAINGLVSCDGSGAYTAKVIGTDVQAYDADLTAIAALTPTDSTIIVGDGSTWVAESGATARTSLGLGTTDSPAFAGLTATDGVTATKATSTANTRAGSFTLTFDASVGDVTYAFGCRNQLVVNGGYNVTNNVSGCSNVVQHNGTGTVALARGAYGQAQVTGGGTLTNSRALEASSPYLAGVGSAIVTACGLYIGAQQITGVTTGYGIYQADSRDIKQLDKKDFPGGHGRVVHAVGQS